MSKRATFLTIIPFLSCHAAFAADDFAGSTATAPAAANQTDEIAVLREKLAEQQKQIESLNKALKDQNDALERIAHMSARGATAEVASLAPQVPASVGQKILASTPALGEVRPVTSAEVNPCEADIGGKPPLFLRLGSVCLTPVGFMDFTSIWRDTNTGSGIGTNFGSIPYRTPNNVAGNNRELRLSTQNSRVGFRVDGLYKGTHVIGYLESDFLGFVPGNAAVTSNSDTLRLRLFWIDARRGNYEVLAGQSWSMLTPNRRGISPLPSDIFYSQDVDTNYQVGLTWTRQSQFRFLLHTSDNKGTLGFSLESPEQYIGGSGGGGLITFPTSLANALSTQLNNGNTTLSTPDMHPDLIVKAAWDPTPKFHAEVAGLYRSFRVYNPLDFHHYAASGGGGLFSVNGEIAKGLRLLTSDYVSDGGGRYVFGLAPDVIVRANGSLSPVHVLSTVDGFEWTTKNDQLGAYYGGAYVGKNIAIDNDGKYIGYGYPGSPNSQNRTIQEVTGYFNHTFWKDARYGAVNLMGQYSYVFRNPWFVAPGSPSKTHMNMVYLNLRYTLPGSAPTIKAE
jgi:uncharacterized coiled-coil protein SlyX